MKYTRQRGTRDLLPHDIKTWHFMESKARDIFERYNCSEIRTPIFEATELFTRSIGEGTDIVGKEMYTFLDKGDRSITLRPEETAPVVRAAIENNLFGQNEPVKLYYIGPMFRYERPQAGRYRQFYQAGVEVFGSNDPLIDVEVIEMGMRFFSEIGLKDLEADINSVGCNACRPKYKEALQNYFKDSASSLCENCQKRMEHNPLRVLDCKEQGCQPFIKGAPWSGDHLCNDCKTHFEKVMEYLNKFGIKHHLNKRLVRGLDYYTRTTFEIISGSLGAQNAVCGGGRYDMLVEELGGKATPAIGFAIGLDRLESLLESQKEKIAEEKRLMVYVAAIGDAGKLKGYEIIKSLRDAGVSADMDYQGRSLNSQLKMADKMKARFAVIIGDEELSKGEAIIKSMDDQTQDTVMFDDISSMISGKGAK